MYAHRRSITKMILVQKAPDLGMQWAIQRADGCALQGKSLTVILFFCHPLKLAFLNAPIIKLKKLG